jgi:hypothetical protein
MQPLWGAAGGTKGPVNYERQAIPSREPSHRTRALYMKRKTLKVVRKGAVLEGELPKTLQKRGPKWLKIHPKMKLIRGRSKEKPED